MGRNHNLPAYFICFFLLASVIHVVFAADYVPTESILLNCGAKGEAVDDDGRTWMSDVGSKFASAGRKSIASDAAIQKPSVPMTPYMTAQIFQSQFTYSFPVVSGRKFVRLYFYPAAYGHLVSSNGVFSVYLGPYTLLKNFSPAETAANLDIDFIWKEYSVNIESGTLNVKFTPAPGTRDSYAFVNGIEIMSHPDIYALGANHMILGTSIAFNIDNFTALETVYRLNVGGQTIPSSRDTGLFRAWEDDYRHLYGAAIGESLATVGNKITIDYPSGTPDYVAPVDVYKTARTMGPNPEINLGYNLSWYLGVDAGFYYLVRLHFCEISPFITRNNQRVFEVFINNQTAETKADVVAWTLKNEVPVYKDYVVFLAPGSTPRRDLWLALHPNKAVLPNYLDAILNGVEVFKLNTPDGNLAGSFPLPALKQDISNPSARTRTQARPTNNSRWVIAVVVVGGIFAVIVAGIFVYYFCSCKAKQPKTPGLIGGWLGSLSGYTCFPFSEIEMATNSFDEARVIGEGRFAKVYKGTFDGGVNFVAIKRLNSDKGERKFRTEVAMLPKLRHHHLISYIGYCSEKSEMILVYEYMDKGTLRNHLHNNNNNSYRPLTWEQLLRICREAACALHYLHTGSRRPIIHRDVTTNNILLDDNLVAKVSDFGLSKECPAIDRSQLSSYVKGSGGYLDPEYCLRQILTDKSDVFSFGVVLFEVICDRAPLDRTLPKEQQRLAEWAPHCYRNNMLDQIIDPYFRDNTNISPQCLAKYVETAVSCLNEDGTTRPSMANVLWNLEDCVELQQSAGEASNVVPSNSLDGTTVQLQESDGEPSTSYNGIVAVQLQEIASEPFDEIVELQVQESASDPSTSLDGIVALQLQDFNQTKSNTIFDMAVKLPIIGFIIKKFLKSNQK